MKYVKYFLILIFASAVAAFGLYLATSSEQAQEVFLPTSTSQDDISRAVRGAPLIEEIPDLVGDIPGEVFQETAGTGDSVQNFLGSPDDEEPVGVDVRVE